MTVPKEVIEVTADKGYVNTNDMVKCLENGIIPHVILDDGKDGYEIEIPFCEAEVSVDSTKAEDLSKALHAGVIPAAYKDAITDIQVVEVKKAVKDDSNISTRTSKYGSPQEMKEKRLKVIL